LRKRDVVRPVVQLRDLTSLIAFKYNMISLSRSENGLALMAVVLTTRNFFVKN
jgi:hypothetical protein